MIARKGDVILIAGKGHEDYQDILGVKHHFDDREVVREIFERRGV
jgi:UDP-N-acetylmuramoyl-L-alanyl-D-glutamate--2,6-diaminopimelate ligase